MNNIRNKKICRISCRLTIPKWSAAAVAAVVVVISEMQIAH
jgi:hypothetical protein